MIPVQFWKEIRRFENKFVLVSGGVDSTYIAYEFYKRGVECSYLHNDTGLTLKSSRDTLKKLYEETKENVTEFHKVKAANYLKNETVKDVIREAFSRMDIQESRETYERKLWKCCYKLKHSPTLKFLKENNLQPLLISGITRANEGTQRRIFLSILKKKKSFLHYHTSKNLWYAYPLRDQVTELKLDGVKHSGCTICPVLLYFRMYKEEPVRYAKSKKFFLENFRDAKFCSKLDKSLDEFITQEVI